MLCFDIKKNERKISISQVSNKMNRATLRLRDLSAFDVFASVNIPPNFSPTKFLAVKVRQISFIGNYMGDNKVYNEYFNILQVFEVYKKSL